MNKRPGGKLPSSPLKKMMSIHPPQGVFITVIYRDPYGEWTDIEPEHFLLPCLDTKLFDFSFYEVWGKDCGGFSTQEFPNVASFAAVLVNDLGRQHVGVSAWTELAKRAEKYEGRVAFGTKHVTICYVMRD